VNFRVFPKPDKQPKRQMAKPALFLARLARARALFPFAEEEAALSAAGGSRPSSQASCTVSIRSRVRVTRGHA
jgi:hypothetical protein